MPRDPLHAALGCQVTLRAKCWARSNAKLGWRWVDWQEGSEEAAEVYERMVVAEIRTRSERQEAFPQLDRFAASESARQGSAAMPRGDIFMVRHPHACPASIAARFRPPCPLYRSGSTAALLLSSRASLVHLPPAP